MFSKQEFMRALRGKGMTLEELAIELGLALSTLYRKMNGDSDFTRCEIYSICKILNTSDPRPIFFTE